MAGNVDVTEMLLKSEDCSAVKMKNKWGRSLVSLSKSAQSVKSCTT